MRNKACLSCDRPANSRGLCSTCLYKWRMGRLTVPGLHDPPPRPVCAVPGCDRNTVARQLCEMHYHAVRTGRMEAPKGSVAFRCLRAGV